MKRLARAEGFTIVETLIVLAVTAGMFVVAALAFSGQQEKTRFTQGTRDAESKILDVANDVSAGFFAETDEWECLPSATSSPIVQRSSLGAGQGTNQACIFIGKALQFGPDDANCSNNCTTMRIATVVGHRTTTPASGTRDVETLAETRPGAAPSGSPYDERYLLKYGLGAYRIINGDNGTLLGGIAFLSSLGVYEGTDPVGGSQVVGMYALPGSGTLGISANTFDTNLVRAVRDRMRTATICFRDNRNGGRLAAVVLTEQATGIASNLIVDNVPAGCN